MEENNEVRAVVDMRVPGKDQEGDGWLASEGICRHCRSLRTMPRTEHSESQERYTVEASTALFLQVLAGPFLASIRHSCLLCQLCLEHCFETVRMRLKVTQSIVEVVQ